jgi:F-type H+-transporting ATPase subunit a
MRLSPDEVIFWQLGFIKLNATILFTWGLMLALAVGSKLVTRKLSTGLQRSRWQNLLEVVVIAIETQIEEVGLRQPARYLGFLGTLFLFVAAAALGTVIPGYEPPTGSLLTTVALALALCVFVAVPRFGIEEQGIGGYLMTALGLLTGMVQAYIFFILATVYIAAATRTRRSRRAPAPTS